jgi:hypothetical protein
MSVRARDANRRRAGANAGRDLEEVVIGACRGFPRLAIGRDFHLRRAAVGVDNLGGEPELRYSRFGVDGERAGDLWAVHELVGGVDDALGGAVESGEGVGEEVEVAFVAFGALVDDLDWSARNDIWLSRR